MTASVLLDVAGRRRSPATLPGYHAGRVPHNKGQSYPADPPTVEEIVAVMRQAPESRRGYRVRAMIVVLWRAGLRVQEALALIEADLDERRGALLVRHGKGGRRREIGMDAWGWEQLRPWLTARADLPVGALFCVIDGPTRGRAWSVCAPPAPPRPRARARPRRRGAEHHPAPARSRQPRHHLDLPAGHRHRGDHRRRPQPARADDVRHRRSAALTTWRERPNAHAHHCSYLQSARPTTTPASP